MSRTKSTTIKRDGLRRRLQHEAYLAIRFALVGCAATAVHIFVLWTLLSNTLLPVLIANAIAFLSAFGFSFTGNYLWTFGALGAPSQALQRFFLVSICAFILNSLLLAIALKLGWSSEPTAAMSVALIMPLITFFCSRLWAFNSSSSTSVHSN